MENSHEIIIDNLQENETVSYPLVIIKGHIQNLPNSSCQTTNLISVNNINSSVIKNKFKVLYELQTGQNIIQLKYCCLSIEFRLNYCPRQTNHSVLPLYIICDGHTGEFQAPPNSNNSIESACNRITTCTKLLQSVIAEKLHEENLGRKTFHLEGDCRLFYSKLNYLEARKMSQEQLWNSLGREIANSDIAKDFRKFLGFLSCTRYCGEKYDKSQNLSHDDLVKLTEGYVALGGGGLALFGSHCLFSWPKELNQVIKCFENKNPIDRTLLFDDSCYRNTFGTCFSTTLGSVLHELCHTFDLGHTEKGIMGRGFDNIDKVFIISEETDLRPDLSQSFQSTIEFKEEFEPERLSERLLEKKKGFNVTKHGKGEEDYTFWTRSCSVFLAYHKWFNDYQISDKILKFDSGTKIITSTAGLRVVEIRKEENEMVVDFWVFDGRVLKYSFQIPGIKSGRAILIVEDNVGNILKEIVENV